MGKSNPRIPYPAKQLFTREPKTYLHIFKNLEIISYTRNWEKYSRKDFIQTKKKKKKKQIGDLQVSVCVEERNNGECG